MKSTLFSLLLVLGSCIASAQHYKKDGTPDRRYKENKTYTSPKTYSGSTSHSHRSNYATGVSRDSNGRIKRSQSARHEFMKMTGYPHGRKGYVIDHIIPLKKGGCDCPSNMQWQTKEEAKAKDRWEKP